MTEEARLDAAFKTALGQYEEIMGQPLATLPRCQWVDAPEFWAAVRKDPDGFALSVTTGLVAQTARFWAEALADEGFLAGVGQPIAADADQLTQLSLVWLMLHELHHIDMNHFDLTGSFAIAETRNAPTFDVARRTSSIPTPIDRLPAPIRSDAPYCLELQADHDAAEMLLEGYSTEEWPSLRHRTMAVSAMMMLIEREDAKHGDHGKTHPKAATRIFQLLGHIAELPLIPAQVQAHLHGMGQIDPNDLPPKEEQQAYLKQVTIPCFFDAVHLARVAGADRIRQDLGEPQAFFADIVCAKLGRFDELKTTGAKEWAALKNANCFILESAKSSRS